VFKVRSKAARLGRNPRLKSGAVYPIPAHEAVSFKASQILRRAVETIPHAGLADAAE